MSLRRKIVEDYLEQVINHRTCHIYLTKPVFKLLYPELIKFYMPSRSCYVEVYDEEGNKKTIKLPELDKIK